MRGLIHSRRQILSPVKGCKWASEMVLNPAIIQDGNTDRIHMLFRATGPYAEKKIDSKPDPYPIFLGYGWSDDQGVTWKFDLDNPALAPKLEYEIDKIYIQNDQGDIVVNYANGCIEDPRLFYIDGECFLTAACRMFPPGPYWEHDEPTQCSPDWVASQQNPFGKAASQNLTVNVLFKVNLERLSVHDYEYAFQYITNLTNPAFGEDRDVFLFPQKLEINGMKRLVMLHRPVNPSMYPFFDEKKPSIAIAAADRFGDFANFELHRELLAVPLFSWENERIAASVPPIKIGEHEWLLCYHGKKDDITGYTQSFMILEEQNSGLPKITHRCAERLIKAEEKWELPQKFKTPCIFITGMIRIDGRLLVSYGAADEKIGIMEIELKQLIDFIKKKVTIQNP